METPFERLAKVLDNASANYLSESQRQQQLADQRAYAAQQLADQRGYAAQQLADERGYRQEEALFKNGYLSKPVGQNTPEEIVAAAGLAAQHALAIRNEEESTRKDMEAKRAHDAKQREREEQGWALNPLKSDERKAMEAAVDGGMINFGKPASKMSDEELTKANAEVKADAIKRADAGDDYANRIQEEFVKANAAADPTPTAEEIKRARMANPPKSSSLADRQMAEETAQQMAAKIAEQRAAYAAADRTAIRYLMSDVLKKGHYPAAPAALGVPTPGPAEAPTPVSAPAPTAPAALGLDDQVKRNVISAGIDKDWPQIQEDYQIAALGDDAIRERINQPTLTRSRLSRFAYEPAISRPATPAEVAARLEGIRSSQAEAKQRLRKRRGDLALYAPADPERAKQLASILALFPQESAVTQNSFNSVVANQ